MFNLKTDLIVFDLELNQPSNSIIEIGAVILNRHGKLADCAFQTYVSLHKERLNPEITELTGITEGKLLHAPDIWEAVKSFRDWGLSYRSSNLTLACWGPDVWMLQQQCEKWGINFPFRRSWLDIKTFAHFQNAFREQMPKKGGLGKTANFINVPVHEPRHRALNDAITTARVAEELIRRQVEFRNTLKEYLKK